MNRLLVFATLCLAPAGCGVPDRSADALDVEEAVFRYRLRNHPTDVHAFLQVDGGDASEDLLNRLRKDYPNVAPNSAEPAAKGLRLRVEGVRWIGRDAAEVEAGYWFPTRFAGEGGFGDHRLQKEGRRWVVKEVTNQTMS